MKYLKSLAVLFSIIMLCLTIPAWLNMDSEIFINFPLILIILSLSYIFILKLPTIVSAFREKTLPDILFVIIIFTSLFIPLSNMSREFTSDYEERILAKFPKQVTLHFGKDLDNWFNDRFLGRDLLIRLHNNLVVLFSGDLVRFPTVHFYKSNGWIFANNSYNGKKYYTKDDLKNISQNIKRLNNFCKQNDIKLYVMVVPSKEIIYQDKDKIKNFTESQNKVLPAIKDVKLEDKFGILYPQKQFLQLKSRNKYVYFKTDTHPTDDAAYVLYKFFIKNARQNLPNLKMTSLSEYNKSQRKLVRASFDRDTFDYGTYYRFIHIDDKNLLNTKYTYYDYKKLKDINIDNDGLHQTLTNNNGRYKLFILGDSFQENLTYFLISNFYQIDKWRGNSEELEPKRLSNLDMNVFAPIIKRFEPDAVLIVLHQDNMDWLIDMYPKSGGKK